MSHGSTDPYTHAHALHREEAIKRRQKEMEEEEQAEAAARAAGGAGGAGGMGGMPAGMEAMFSDPEIMKAMQNPKVMQAMMEMQTGGTWCLI